MSQKKTSETKLYRLAAGQPSHHAEDHLAVEEPLEIRIHDEPVAVTMRTPSDDFDLAAGFLFTEGIIESNSQIGTIRYCDHTEKPELKNVVNVTLASNVTFDPARLKRNFYATSSCGICGKASIEQVRVNAKPLKNKIKAKTDLLYTLPKRLREAQSAFDQTGGLHAAGIFTAEGELQVVREDVGRHNAVDKAIGALLLRDKLPIDEHILMVSGRAGFEIMQKAFVARISFVCAVSAPSSLAVQFAEECGMTLVGFLRHHEMNVYSGADQVVV